MSKVYLGVDVGSISINFVLIDAHSAVLFQSYIRGSGDPVQAVQQGLGGLSVFMDRFPDYEIAGVCTTGSGRELLGVLLGADLVKNEISAHARAAIHLYPDVHTIIEIGGQDSKVTVVRDGVVVDFAMNLVCAAGTGSFLDSQARRLNISIEEFGRIAMLSQTPTSIAGRCTVFAESDMIHKQQIGFPQKDIIMGLCLALVRNFVGNVCRGKELLPPFLFQGGVSANPGIRKAFETVLGHPVIIPEYHMVMGAYGAAILALREGVKQTRFRGCAVSRHDVHSAGFICQGCSNQCEIIEIRGNGELIGRSSGRCDKWNYHSGSRV
ncbi:MAG: acyl-CoA dehydratase activase [Spirochaetia bacterium]|jgi:predicted CoA-substrate-specific enzyme activase|nr:acyl-CoA dehydratase activase [Spirochaetia bacterium]